MSDYKYGAGEALINRLANKKVRVIRRGSRVSDGGALMYYVNDIDPHRPIGVPVDEYWIAEEHLDLPPWGANLKGPLSGKPEPKVENDVVNNPKHYTQFPVEPIEITRHLDFASGNVVKYVCRAPFKGNELQDLRKAKWYLEDRIKQIEQKQEKEAA